MTHKLAAAPSETRCLIYIRVSTKEQSTQMQRDALEAYAKQRCWTIAKLYDDTGFSGTTDQRPGLTAMLADIRQGKANVVLIWKLDRLFRSLKHMVVTLDEFRALNVDLVSLKDNLDLSTPAGRLMFNMVSAFAEFEADLIRDRVKAGLANAVAKGKRLGRKPDKAITNEARELIRTYRDKGDSIRTISAKTGHTPSQIHRLITQQTKSVTAETV